ncbi:MAG: acireductone synthase [Chlamydiae bacterium]|nr:acireductone synthase [Chlamydiota bacterium]
MKWIFSLFCLQIFAYEAILTDIEGTTTSISFVRDTLFPYAKEHMRDFIEKNQSNLEVQRLLGEVQAISHSQNLEEVITTLYTWMDQDQKITPLKVLQGMLWEEGYERGDFYGHIYEDALDKFIEWQGENLSLYVYSSGSIHAQKLLFSHTQFGDLTPLFSGFFDTTIGKKKDISSYLAIAKAIGCKAEEILFLSDSIDEINAAIAAGMKSILLVREGENSDTLLPFVSTFQEIDLQSSSRSDLP